MSHEHEADDLGGAADRADLRDLYRRLQPLPLADGADESDPGTARLVSWMRGAWSEVTPPATVQPSSLRAVAPPRTRRRSPWLGLAAAATVLAIAGAALWRARPGIERPAVPEHDGSPDRLAQGLAPTRAPVEPTPTPADTIEVRVTGPDRLELCSGPVRLVLLAPPTETSDTSTGS